MKPLKSAAKNTATLPAIPARQRNAQQRATSRRPFRVPCRVRLVDNTGRSLAVNGETLNISDGGVSLQLATEVPLGTWIETLLPHPDGDPLFLCGTVVHCRRTLASQYEVGVETSTPPFLT